VTENAPPQKGKGSASRHTSEALEAHHLKPRRQAKVTTEEVVAGQNAVKTFNGIGGEK
jgi:hypothetical protein